MRPDGNSQNTRSRPNFLLVEFTTRARVGHAKLKRVAREWFPVVVECRRTKQYTHPAENADADVDDEEDAVYDESHVLPLVTYL